MPIVRTDSLLIYYAHVPKCAGSSIEQYLEDRFGQVAMVDTRHHAKPSNQRWSRTSPQHMTLEVLNRLFPPGFFDHSFAVVRHPVGRIISAYHFQLEIEYQPAARVGFSEWLDMLPETMAEDPFVFDNHTRPMAERVPPDAQIFHLEHGVDPLILWLDAITGVKAGPRALRKINDRQGRGGKTEKVTPSSTDLKRIEEIYGADFTRFGYEIGRKDPLAPPPELPPDFIAERDADLARMSRPTAWLRERLSRAIK